MEIPNITKENLKIPELDSLIKQENNKILNAEKDSSKIVNNSIKNYEFTIQKDAANFEYFKYKNGQLVKIQKNIKDNLPPIPRKQKYFNDSWFFTQTIQTYIDFYPNNSISNIRQYNDTSSGAYPAGNWYAYDEDGNLLQHIDHEQHFRMSYYDVAKIADSYDYPSIRIGRSFDENKSFWIIQLNGLQDQPIKPKTIIIGDKTGKLLYEMNQEELNNFRAFDDMTKYGEDLYRLFKQN